MAEYGENCKRSVGRPRDRAVLQRSRYGMKPDMVKQVGVGEADGRGR